MGSPSSKNELFLFGGEYYNGALATFYNDLFVYLIDRNEWRLVTSPNSPLPRSGHAWCRGDNAGGIYLFGGKGHSQRHPLTELGSYGRQANSVLPNKNYSTTSMISGGWTHLQENGLGLKLKARHHQRGVATGWCRTKLVPPNQ